MRLGSHQKLLIGREMLKIFHIHVDITAARHNSNTKKSCPLFGHDAAGAGRDWSIPDKMPEKRSIMHSPSSNQTNLVLVRELYEGMTVVISAQRGVSEFLEYVLEDLAPGGDERVRVAVRRAHQRLGLTQ
jgi:hypothetical protein